MEPLEEEIQFNETEGWIKKPSIKTLNEELDYAKPEHDDQVVNINGWLDLRNVTGNEAQKKRPGKSSVTPKLIRKLSEERLPGLTEPFLNSHKMFTIKPRTAEDADAAKQNELLINYQFDTKIDKVSFIDRYVRTNDAEGMCILRVGWERNTKKIKVVKPTYNYYEIQDQQQLDLLNQAIEIYNGDPKGTFLELPDEIQAAVLYSLENELYVYAMHNGEEEVFEDKIVKNCPDISIVDINNFYIDPSCDGVWQDAQYMIHTFEANRDYFTTKDNYYNLDKVDWSATTNNPTTDVNHVSQSPVSDLRTNSDKTKVLVYEYWGMYDIYDNGQLHPITVSWIGNTIVQMMENPFPDGKPPFVISHYNPILKSSFGESDANIIADDQRIVGAVRRGVIDVMGRSANGQIGFAKGALDKLNRKRFTRGEDFEFNPGQDPESTIRLLQYPELSQSATLVAAQHEAEARALVGSPNPQEPIAGNNYGRISTPNPNSRVNAREMSILRRLAQGIKVLGDKIIAMNAVYLDEAEVVRVTNSEYVTINKEDLAGNFDLMIDISTAAVDEEKAADLGFIMQTVGPDMEPGLRGHILAEIVELKRMPALAERIRNYQPQPDPLDAELKQLEIEKLKVEIEVEKQKAAALAAKTDNIAMDTQLDAQGIKHQREMEKQGEQAKGNSKRDITNALLAGNTGVENIEAATGALEVL